MLLRCQLEIVVFSSSFGQCARDVFGHVRSLDLRFSVDDFQGRAEVDILFMSDRPCPTLQAIGQYALIMDQATQGRHCGRQWRPQCLPWGESGMRTDRPSCPACPFLFHLSLHHNTLISTLLEDDKIDIHTRDKRWLCTLRLFILYWKSSSQA